MAAVDRSSPMPVYFQIALDVRRRIAAGEWNAGERIAPELQLVREYAVSRVTIRQALAELVKDDLLERHRGSGTYVREQQHPLVYDLNLTVGTMATRLREEGLDNRADVIETRRARPPAARAAPAAADPARGQVVYLVRRILINDEPTAVYRSWFDAARVPGLHEAEGLDGSLSAVLAEQYGLVPARGDNSLEVVRFTREDAELLGSPHDVPLLVVTRHDLPAGRRPARVLADDVARRPRPLPLHVARRRSVRASTRAPSSQSAVSVHSDGEWLMPSREGTNSIPAAARRPTSIASWPAPDTIRNGSTPSSRVAASIAAITSGSMTVGSSA